MKEQRGMHTSNYDYQIQMNSIVYEVFKKALKAAIESGIDKNLSRKDFMEACGFKETDTLMIRAYDVIVLGHKE